MQNSLREDRQDATFISDEMLELSGYLHYQENSNKYRLEFAVHHLLRDQAQRTPSHIALVDSQRRITYRELIHQIDYVSIRLIELGIKHGDRVVVQLPRSVDLVCAFFAILQIGGIYIPISTDVPRQRIVTILEDTRAALIIDNNSRGVLQRGHKGLAGSQKQRELLADILQQSVDPGSIAYVIYTSGSTGTPKGVEIRHWPVVNFVSWRNKFYQTSTDDVFLFKASPAFDISISEMITPLTAGAALVVADEGKEGDINYLLQLVKVFNVTRLSLLPSMLKAMLPYWASCASVRDVACGGDTLKPELVAAFFRVAPSCRLHNLYGPTEATLLASNHTCSQNDDSPVVPIGRPNKNVVFLVLDEELNLLTRGEAGELFITGDCLAAGYLNDEKKTQEKFIENPFRDLPFERLYRSGDLVRWNSRGDLEFLGRCDNQVKVCGFRIELEEVEAALLKYPGVSDVAVVVANRGMESQMLVAHLVPAETEPTLCIDKLANHLRQVIPRYMVPAQYVFAQSLPLTRNGKIDRSCLEKHEICVPERREAGSAFLNSTEQKLLQICAELLETADIATTDDLFELGGNSILVARIAMRIRDEFDCSIDITSIYAARTIGKILALIQAQSPSHIIQCPNRTDPYVASLEQARVWRRIRAGTPSHEYNLVVRLPVKDADFTSLTYRLNAYISQHESLRTKFVFENDVLSAHVQPPGAYQCPVVRHKFRHADCRTVLNAIYEHELRHVFREDDQALLRLVLISIGLQKFAFLNIHHSITDGYSLFNLKEAVCGIRSDSLAVSPRSEIYQYRDFVAWQMQQHASGAFDEYYQFWRKLLSAGITPSVLRKSRVIASEANGPNFYTSIIGSRDFTALKKYCGDNKLAVNAVLVWASIMAYREINNEDSLVTNMVFNARTRPELESLHGLVRNVVLCRFHINSDSSNETAQKEIVEQYLFFLRMQNCPLPYLVAEIPSLEKYVKNISLIFQGDLLARAEGSCQNDEIGVRATVPYMPMRNSFSVHAATTGSRSLSLTVAYDPSEYGMQDAEKYSKTMAEYLLSNIKKGEVESSVTDYFWESP